MQSPFTDRTRDVVSNEQFTPRRNFRPREQRGTPMSTTQDLNAELPTRDEPLDDALIASIIKTLEADRAALLDPLEVLEGEEPGDQDLTDDPGTRLAEAEMHRALTSMQEQHLQEIDDALERIVNGSYGACLDCGVDIPAVRLEAVPTARYCVDCQAEHSG